MIKITFCILTLIMFFTSISFDYNNNKFEKRWKKVEGRERKKVTIRNENVSFIDKNEIRHDQCFLIKVNLNNYLKS